jgi:hypothetical protein
MKQFFWLLTAGLLVVGFINPLAWILVPFTAFLAIGAAPAGRRADGKARTGGLLGGLWDDWVVHSKMDECPYCRTLISREASKCPNCKEWVDDP